MADPRDASAPVAGPQAPVVPPRRRAFLRWLWRGALLFAVLVVLTVIAVPFVLSSGAVRRRIEAQLAATLHTGVHLDGHSLGWLSGVELRGLRVDNPPGFPKDWRPIELQRLHAETSLFGLLRGRMQLKGTVEGLAVRLHERKDGTTNLAVLFGGGAAKTPGPAPETPPQPAPPQKGDSVEAQLAKIALDLRLDKARIDVSHEELGMVESLREVTATVAKPFGSTTAEVHFAADLHRTGAAPGRLELDVSADARRSEPSTFALRCRGVDLASYRPLVNSFLPAEQRLRELGGALEGTLQGRYRHGAGASVNGELQLLRPAFAGGALQTLRLDGERWVLRPGVEAAVDASGNVQSVSTAGLLVDLGFAKVEGLDSAAARAHDGARAASGLAFSIDLGKLARMGAPGLECLRQGAGAVEGRATLAMEPRFEPDKLASTWSQLLRATARIRLDGLQQSGVSVRGLQLDLLLKGAEATLQSLPGGTINGGAARIAGKAKLVPADAATAEIDLEWTGGTIGGDAVRLLRYGVPLLAGMPLDKAGSLDLAGLLDTKLHFAGPALPGAKESLLAWANRWAGSGNLGLREGRVAPAQAWSSLLAFAKLDTPIDFDAITSKFRFQQGAVATELMKFNRKAASWSLQGEVKLDGSIDYRIDLRQLLAGHRDGEKVLKYLGSQPLNARILGSLDAPRLEARSYRDLLTDAVKSAAKQGADQLLEKSKSKLEKGLRDLLKRR
ncbi:MAG: hypothetical protein H6837_06160 [Planctomycetes bacterium]|nr:hypothetical protein [Planctomycetota bacterium]